MERALLSVHCQVPCPGARALFPADSLLFLANALERGLLPDSQAPCPGVAAQFPDDS